MTFCAILLAAGKSERFGKDKLLLRLGDKPVWKHSFDQLVRHPDVEAVGIVCSLELEEWARKLAPEACFLTRGGATRQESAQLGFNAAPERFDGVLFHDAARPFLTGALISRVIEAVRKQRAAGPALPVIDTIKQIEDGKVRTLDRGALVAVQTPQGAPRQLLERAFRLAGGPYSDEMSMLEALGETPTLVAGDPRNVKITNALDFEVATRTLLGCESRTGIGYDIHAFSPDPARPLFLGGVQFPEERGLQGHSDADALLHAIVDALLGAAALGDIGVRYPPSDMQWKNARSTLFLKETALAVRNEGWNIVHIDATVLAESPKIMKMRDQICQAVAEVLNIEHNRVNVKATTNERLGAVGRGEGIAAFAVATLSR